jgi:hypothetical protein
VDWKDVLVDTDSGLFALELNLLNDDAVTYKAKEVILSSATGDFDGNGELENVYIKTIHDATLDDSGYWEYSIIFSDTKFPPLVIENHEAGGCRVANNLNTDGKPGDELSVFTSGMMNKVIQEVYGFNGKRWEQLSKEVNTNSSN